MLDKVSSYKYLEYVMTENCGNRVHIDELIKAANRIMKTVWSIKKRKF